MGPFYSRYRVINALLCAAAIVIALISIGSAVYIYNSTKAKEQERFEYLSNSIKNAVVNRMATYIGALRGAGGFFGGSESVTAREFYTYTRALKLDHDYPGLRGIGFSYVFTDHEQAALIARMQTSEAVRDFRVYPDSNEAQLHSVLFLYPQDERNTHAVGYNMFTEPIRRAAMETARDTGEPSATGKVILVQDVGQNAAQPGFLIFLPIYNKAPSTVEERRQFLAGFVYCQFRGGDLLREVLAHDLTPRIDVVVRDGTEVLHDSRKLPLSDGYTPKFMGNDTLTVAGRGWNLEFLSRPEFDGEVPAPSGLWMLVVGGLVSAMLVWAIYMRARVFQELTRTEEELTSSREKLQALIHSSEDAIVTKSLNGTILSWNPSAERIFGYTAEEALGKSIYLIIPPEKRDEEKGILARISRGIRVEHLETERMRKDGSRIFISVSSSPIKDTHGNIVGAAKIARDITDQRSSRKMIQENESKYRVLAEERNRLLEQERSARAEIERVNRIKDEFLLTLSHELRTPLNAILGWAQLMARGQVKAANMEEGAKVIERNARTQAQIINDLLDMNRIVSGKILLDMHEVDLDGVLQSGIDTVMPSAHNKGIKINAEFAADQVRVLGDASRLQQVFWNILSNAVKFTPHDGTITVRSRSTADTVEITFSDTGQGISPEFLPFIFDRFRQGDASTTRRQGGLGLGLSIARQLVELHGGTITAQSAGVDKGSQFIITLPQASDASGERARAPHGEIAGGWPLQANGSSLNDKVILVVDDEADARELMKVILTDQGAEVHTAKSVREALDVLEEHQIDLILSDIGMPDEDGYELIRRVRQLPKDKSRIPAIAVTAFARTEDRSNSIAAGFQTHVSKPIEAAELIAAVGAIAREARAATIN